MHKHKIHEELMWKESGWKLSFMVASYSTLEKWSPQPTEDDYLLFSVQNTYILA